MSLSFQERPEAGHALPLTPHLCALPSRSHSFGCERVFSRHVRVPPGAPCIFGSIQQAGAAAYAPEASFWASEILRQTIWVGGRGPARQYHAFRVAPGPKMTPIVRPPRFTASPTGTAMLNTPVFARSKRGYVGTGRGAPVYLCITKAKLCKTIGHHAPNTQIGGDMRRDKESGAPPGIAMRVTKL